MKKYSEIALIIRQCIAKYTKLMYGVAIHFTTREKLYKSRFGEKIGGSLNEICDP